jgi:hypothetical protein
MGSRKVVHNNTTILPNCGGTNGAGCNQDLIVDNGGEVILEPPNLFQGWFLETLTPLDGIYPQGIVFDSRIGQTNYAYVVTKPASGFGGTIRSYNLSTQSWAPQSVYRFSSNNVTPGGITMDGNGNLYTFDRLVNNEVILVKIPVLNGVSTTLVYNITIADPSVTPYPPIISPITPATLGILWTNGTIYYSDGNSIRKVTFNIIPANSSSAVVAGNPVPGYVDSNTNGLNARFNYICQIAARIESGTNYLYVADSNNNCIRKIDSTGGGITTTYAGITTPGYQNGIASVAQFKTPKGITIDSTGIVYIADTNNSVIRKIDTSGNVTLFAGSYPNQGHADGPALTITTLLNNPITLFMIPSNDELIYVGDASAINSGGLQNFRQLIYYP